MDKHTIHIEDLPGAEPLELPFLWRDLPRRNAEPGGYASVSRAARWTTTLKSGREVRLTGLHQYLTYEGVLCGLPTDDEVRGWPIEGLVRMADQLHQCAPWEIAILPPELTVSRVSLMRNGKLEEITVDFLPAVACIASFESDQPVLDEHSDGSEVIAVWFQHAFGPPEPGHVVDSIRKIDWDELAGDLLR